MAVAVAALAGCGAPPPPPPPPPPAEPEAPAVTRDVLLQWSGDGDQIFVDARWRLRVDTGTFEALAAPDPTAIPAISPRGDAVIFEPGRFVVLGGGRQVKVPSFVEPPLPDLDLTGFWLDADRLYLHQHHPAWKSPACRVFHLRNSGFTTPAGCLSGEHPSVVRLQRGPGDLVAIHTRDGDAPGLRIVRYTPDFGQRPVALPPLDLRPAGPLDLGFRADGAAATLISPCLLDQPRPCAATSTAGGRVGLYVLDLAAGKMSERLAVVPPGTAPAPDGRRLAWVRGGQICIGSPRTPGATWCHTPPDAR
ncbi:MAG: hypothetical protein H6706_06135 [Myxococcales bacterium]|nr:hypothetical protein [Myxococcales bacterium]